MKRLLGIFAHPDDESFTAGGTIAKYVKAGWQVDLVCATLGEAGQTGDTASANSRFLGEVRQKELKDAAAELGVTSITFLEYKDGNLSAEIPGEIEDKLTGVFIDAKPDVVITMEPTGITNHPDHVKLTLSATFAFQQYAWARHEDKSDLDNPPKLYFGCMPESIATYFLKKRYIPAESFDKPWRGVEDKRITTIIDIKRFAAVKSRALRAHESQKEEVDAYLSIPHNPFLSQEYYILRMVGLAEAFMGKNDRISDRL